MEICPETYRAEIAVEVTPMQSLQKLDWKWIFGIVVTLLLVPGFWRWFDQRSRQNASTGLPESKYAPLKKYFADLPKKQQEVTLTFAEIEAILNDKLPDSPRKYKGWWANDIRGRHVQAVAWLDAGWKMESVDLTKR